MKTTAAHVPAIACGAAVFAATLAAAPRLPWGERALRVDADCRLDAPVALEPLGERDEETIWAATARCRARAGPLAGASADVAWVWEVDRGRVDLGASRWREGGGSVALPAGEATVRRDAHGGWRADARGTAAGADGRAGRFAGQAYVLTLRLPPTEPIGVAIDAY